jgi:hypothetical protein
MPPGLRDVLTVKADHLVNNLNPKGSFAVARTARRETPEAFQGFHEANMLFIADEASGVDDIIFEVGEGSMSTTGAKTVLTGNPTRTVGYFYNSHHRDRAEWFTMKVACADSSQVDPKYIERMAVRYGKDSNIYKIRVLGDFPTEDEDAVIPLSLIEDAIGRDVETSGQVLWGLDVARQGQDRCALAKRRGNTLLEPIAHWKASDLMVTAGRVHQMYIDTPLDEKPEKIYVDVIGMGYGVLDRLRGLGMPVMGVNVAEAPAIGHTYNRLRDELWFKAREWFMRRDCKLPNDESLMAELSIPKFYYTQSGKIRVTPKEDIKKMGLQSPDLADAFCLTFAVLGDRVHRGAVGMPNIGVV